MSELTPLERRIKAAALWEIRRIERKGIPQSNMPTIRFAFMCDGVIDILDYDNINKRWDKILYEKGVGKPALFGIFSESGAYFDKTETKTILLTEPK